MTNTESAENVVTNVADLSRAMRTALLEEHATRQTTEALIKRGLVSGRAGSPRGNHYPLTLTDAGRRAAEAIRAEIDATPVVPVRSIASAIQTLAETRGVDSGTQKPLTGRPLDDNKFADQTFSEAYRADPPALVRAEVDALRETELAQLEHGTDPSCRDCDEPCLNGLTTCDRHTAPHHVPMVEAYRTDPPMPASVAVHDGVYIDLDNGLTGFTGYLDREYRDARESYRRCGLEHYQATANAARATLWALYIWTEGRHGSRDDAVYPRVALANGPAKSEN